MKLTDAVKIWDELPGNFDEGIPLKFEEFVTAIDTVIGITNDIPAIPECFEAVISS